MKMSHLTALSDQYYSNIVEFCKGEHFLKIWLNGSDDFNFPFSELLSRIKSAKSIIICYHKNDTKVIASNLLSEYKYGVPIIPVTMCYAFYYRDYVLIIEYNKQENKFIINKESSYPVFEDVEYRELNNIIKNCTNELIRGHSYHLNKILNYLAR